MKLLDTRLARVLVIVVTTTVVGILLIGFAFLSSGSNKALIPPWQLFVAEAVSVAVLLSLSLGTLRAEKDSSVFLAAIAISTVLTILVAFILGIGHTWSLASAVGKALVAFLVLAYPILVSAVVIVAMRKRAVNLTTLWTVSISLCLLLTVPMVIVGVVLACAVTGDCL